MVIYHLEVEAYLDIETHLQEKYSHKSNVYSTLEKAVKEGKRYLGRRFEVMYKMYCSIKGEDTLTIEDMLNDDMMYYSFIVTEIDPIYADNFEKPNEDCLWINLEPTHKVNCYNYVGELKYTDFTYYYENCKMGREIGTEIARGFTIYPRR